MFERNNNAVCLLSDEFKSLFKRIKIVTIMIDYV
jgi:hypothetical protein